VLFLLPFFRESVKGLVGLVKLTLGRFAMEEVFRLDVPDPGTPMPDFGILRRFGMTLRPI
jgi:hypothetical protein